MRKPKGAKLYSQILTAFLVSSPRWFELGGDKFWESVRPRSDIHPTTRRNRWNFVMDRLLNNNQKQDYIAILKKIHETYKMVMNMEITVADESKIREAFQNTDVAFASIFQDIIDYNNKYEKSEILEVIADVYKRLSRERIADSILRAEDIKERIKKAHVFKLSESIRSELKKKINAAKVILSTLWTITKLDVNKEISRYAYYYSFSLTSYWKTRIRAESATEIENYVYKSGSDIDTDLLNIRLKEEQILSLSSFWNVEEEEEKDYQEISFANRFEEFENFLISYINNLSDNENFSAPIYTAFSLNPQDIHIWKLFRNYTRTFMNVVESLSEDKKKVIKEEFSQLMKKMINAVVVKFQELSNSLEPTAAIIEDISEEPIESIELFPYIGSKKRKSLRETIISKFPKHRIYIEPMVGAGAIFVHKEPVDIAIINDINKLVYEIWEGVKDGSINIKDIDKAYKTFIKRIPVLNKRKEVKKLKEDDKREILGIINEILEKVGYDPNYVFVAAFSLRNGVFGSRILGSFINPLPTESWIKGRYHLMKKAIESQDTHIYNMDAVELLASLRNILDRDDVVIYLDPPYIGADSDIYGSHSHDDILELNRRIIEEIALWNNANIFVSNYKDFLDLAPDMFDIAATIEVSNAIGSISSKSKAHKLKEYLFAKKKTTL